ncbi:MAG TPA: TRAFs-binding domain-containing protein [Anaerolineales bacterium]
MQTTPTPASPESPLPAPSQPGPVTAPPPKGPPTNKTPEPDTTTETRAATHPEVRPHAFVIMPFGQKKGPDGALFEFNAIYSLLIKPALEMAGFEAFRADEETNSGDILTDMFQELLLADLCIADMSIDNANVFYELGIRHAFRKRGIVHIQAGRAYMPFDVFNVRTIPYHITNEGVPDPTFLEKDRAAIARVTRDTWASDAEAIHSPIFNLLDGLKEPDRKTLETPLATGFWREYHEWKQRVIVAERQKRIGDILLLTEEIRNPLIKEEAIGEAALALKNMERYELALTQYRRGLEVNSRNVTFRREEAFNLNRVGKVDEAIVKIERLLAESPDDADSIAYLGRIYKEMWVESWRWVPDEPLRLRTAFDSYHWLLKSFQTYLRGYRLNLDEFYPGINAHTLGTILVYLADQFEDQSHPDPEIQEVRDMLEELRGSLTFALETKTKDEKADYWSYISLGELLVLMANTTQQVARAYRKALTASRRNQFSLQSSLGQLKILESLGMRLEFVQAGMDVINEELRRIRREILVETANPKKGRIEAQAKTGTEPDPSATDGMVFLFAGYTPTKEGKKGNPPRLEKEAEIRAAINGVLDKYRAGPDDLAVSTGMDAGSELIFVECCVERGIPVQAYFPLLEGPYLREFVSPAGDEWVTRFYRMRNHPLVAEYYQTECVGIPKEGDNVHERNNRWALYSALGRGIDKVRLIALWDGKGEMTKTLEARLFKHMVELTRETGGIIETINQSKPPRLPKAAVTPNGKSSKKPVSRKKK